MFCFTIHTLGGVIFAPTKFHENVKYRRQYRGYKQWEFFSPENFLKTSKKNNKEKAAHHEKKKKTQEKEQQRQAAQNKKKNSIHRKKNNKEQGAHHEGKKRYTQEKESTLKKRKV